MRIGRERASTLSELLETRRQCLDDSIFQHTFRTLVLQEVKEVGGGDPDIIILDLPLGAHSKSTPFSRRPGW